MRITKDQIVSALGGKETIDVLLEAAVLPIKGPKALFFKDDGDWLYHEPNRFTEFCSRIREKDAGREGCLGSDRRIAERAEKAGKVVIKMCHAGLIDIAAPIIVNGDCVAYILAGQIHPCTDEAIQKGRLHLAALSEKTGIPYEQLEPLWEHGSKQSTPQKLEEAKETLGRLAGFLSSVITANVTAKNSEAKLRSREERERVLGEEHRFVSEQLADIGALQELLALRHALPEILKAVCTRYGSVGCGILTTARAGAVNDYMVQFSYTPPDSVYVYDSRHARIQGTSRTGIINIKDDPYLQQFVEDTLEKTVSVSLSEIGEGEFYEYVRTHFSEAVEQKADMIISSSSLNREPPASATSNLIFFLFKGDSQREDEKYTSTVMQEVVQAIAQPLARYYRNSELYTERRDFMGDVTHQLITPIVNIEDTCDLVLHEADNASIDWIKRRMLEARDLLGHCRMWALSFHVAATKGEMEPLISADDLFLQTAKVTPLMIEVCSGFQYRAKGKGIFIKADENSLDNIGEQVFDVDWVRQALMALVDNAVKYTPMSCSEPIVLSGQISGNRFSLSVSNTSLLRIKESDHERIFERYYRTSEAEGEEVQGTGLGLVIVKAVGLAHNGKVQVTQRSKSLHGYPTVFSMWFPAM